MMNEKEVKQQIAAMAGMLVDGTEQVCTFGQLVAFLFRNKANRAICGDRVACMLADLLDDKSKGEA